METPAPTNQSFNGWIIRSQPASRRPGRLLLLLHGWTGDENSMWVFTSGLPEDYSILAPRAPFTAPQKGYSWREIIPGTWGLPTVEDLRPAAEKIIDFLADWGAWTGQSVEKFDLMGFSQGAALAYTITLLQPGQVGRLAALSGFLPAGGETLCRGNRLSGKPIFVAHGLHDELVGIDRARQAVTWLERAGAQVAFCEADTGHRVGAGCFSGLGAFFGGSG